MARRIVYPLLALGVATLVLLALKPDWFPGGVTLVQRLRGRATVADRVHQYGGIVHQRLRPDFVRQGVSYPPRRLVLVGLKQEKRLDLYAGDSRGAWRWIRAYPILGASGALGPKLREGDLQVPEGLYRIESLNPNSAFHLALRVNYPNAFDRQHAQQEGRTALGGDIMIHGSNGSVGCLAMGDQAAEDLFVLAAETGLENTGIILSPVDFRVAQLPLATAAPKSHPVWTAQLYAQIRAALTSLPLPSGPTFGRRGRVRTVQS